MKTQSQDSSFLHRISKKMGTGLILSASLINQTGCSEKPALRNDIQEIHKAYDDAKIDFQTNLRQALEKSKEDKKLTDEQAQFIEKSFLGTKEKLLGENWNINVLKGHHNEIVSFVKKHLGEINKQHEIIEAAGLTINRNWYQKVLQNQYSVTQEALEISKRNDLIISRLDGDFDREVLQFILDKL